MPQYKNQVIQEIDGYHNKIVINGLELFAGDVIGDFYEQDFLDEFKSEKPFYSHLKKEKQFDKKA